MASPENNIIYTSALPPTESETLFQFTGKKIGGGGESTVKFMAFIDSYSDNVGASWTDFQNMGMASVGKMYSNYNRSLSVSFKTIATKVDVHKTNLKALNRLASFCMPHYNGINGYNGIVVQLSLGNLIKSAWGIIDSCNISVDNNTPWKDDIPLYVSATVSMQIFSDKNGNKPRYDESASLQPWFDGSQTDAGK